MAKITYATKVGINPKTVHINQVWDDDMNEIKTVVNGLDLQQITDEGNTTDSSIIINSTVKDTAFEVSRGDFNSVQSDEQIYVDNSVLGVRSSLSQNGVETEYNGGDPLNERAISLDNKSSLGDLNESSSLKYLKDGRLLELKSNDLTLTDKVQYLQDKSGTIALLSDVSGGTTEIGYAISDETTALTTGTNKTQFRMPFAMIVTEVRASVTIAPAGSNLIVDINEGIAGGSILSTKLSIDAGERTSLAATTPPVISDNSLGNDSIIRIDIDQVGSVIAGAGLKIYLIGTKV